MSNDQTTIERRFFTAQLRAVGGDESPKIVGYAAVFNQLSKDLGGFREMILPGAFANALSGDVRALKNHNVDLILGRTTAGTLTLTEDDVGLRYEIDPPDAQYARDLIVSIKRGDLDQSSFAFRVLEGGESWREPDQGEPLPVRVLHEVELFDVSPVTFPAYPTTSVATRSKAKELAPDGRATDPGQAEAGRAVGRLAIMRKRLEIMELE